MAGAKLICSSSGTEVKSRLVATEVRTETDACFTGSHPLKALRLVVSLADRVLRRGGSFRACTDR